MLEPLIRPLWMVSRFWAVSGISGFVFFRNLSSLKPELNRVLSVLFFNCLAASPTSVRLRLFLKTARNFWFCTVAVLMDFRLKKMTAQEKTEKPRRTRRTNLTTRLASRTSLKKFMVLSVPN